MEQSIIDIITEILQPTQAKSDDTRQFKGVPHDNILEAYRYWLEYLRLLIKDPYLVEITQGLQDAGVDLVIKFLKSDMKIGLQVKSYQDLKRKNFQQEVMSQISHSKKHGLKKLLIIPCGDLSNKSHSNKIPNLMSNIDQMNDNYAYVIQPQFALPIYQCYVSKKHPLSYLGKSKKVLDLFEGLGQLFSNEDYTAKVNINFNYNHPEKPVPKKDAHTLEIKFKPFKAGKPENPVDKFLQLYQLGEDVRFGNHEVAELVVKYADGRTIRQKPSNFTMFKFKKNVGPLDFYPKDDEKNALKNITFAVEREGKNFQIWKSKKESLPFDIEITISNNAVTFQNKLNFSMCTFKHIAMLQRFYMSLRQNRPLVMKNTPTGDEVELMIQPDQIIPFSEESLQKIEKLEFIQDTLKQSIHYSMETTDYDMPLITELATFLKNRKIEKSPLDFTIECTKDEAKKLIEEFKTKNFIEKYETVADPMLVDIVGQRLNLGKVKINMKKIKILDKLDELEEKILKLSNSEKIEISIIADKDQKDHYELVKLPLE